VLHMVDNKIRRSRIVYRYMDPHEVLIEVIGDIEDAKVRLSLAEAKLSRSGLTESPDNEEIVRFIGAAQRYAEVATKAALRSQGEAKG
jgi:hypothetical protein